MFFNRTLVDINKARDKMEKIIIDVDRFLRTISRISHEIIEKHQDFSNVILVGAVSYTHLTLPTILLV